MTMTLPYLLLLFTSLADLSASQDFKTFQGQPDLHALIGMTLSMNSTECRTNAVEKYRDKEATVAAFCEGTFLCYAFALTELQISFLVANNAIGSRREAEKCWITLVPKTQPDSKLVIFWLLNKVSKGKNFGIAGSALNITTDACEFSGDGFNGSNAQLCKIGGSYRAEVSLRKGDVLLFDFLKAFSIALWIKPRCTHDCVLMEGNYSFTDGLILRQFSDKSRLTFAFNNMNESYAMSTVKENDVMEWSHLAIVYRPPTDIRFFLNAQSWPLQKTITDLSQASAAKRLVLWQSASGMAQFYGDMACVMMFQKALSDSQMRDLKNHCP